MPQIAAPTTFDGSVTDPSVVVPAQRAAYPGVPTELRIGGMTCGACATRITDLLDGIGGISASVNYATRRATIDHPASVRPDVLAAVIEDAGYTVGSSGTRPFAARHARALAALTLALPLLLAVTAAAVWLVSGGGIGGAAAVAGAVLVVAGPGTLVLALPMARRAARSIETQTLTVLDVVVGDGVATDDALAVAGALAATLTDGPLGRAIVDHAAEHAAFWPATYDVTPIDEQGVSGETGARAALMGTPALMRERGIELPEELVAAIPESQATDRASVVLAWDGVARAVLTVGTIG